MKIEWNQDKTVQILPVWEDRKPEEIEDDFWTYLTEEDLFTGKEKQIYGDLGFYGKKQMLVGFGKKEELNGEKLRNGFFAMAKELEKNRIDEAEIDFSFAEVLGEEALRAALEGLLHSTYRYDHYKKPEKELKELTLSVKTELKNKEKIFEEVEALMDGVFFARDLVNEPAMTMTPTKFAAQMRRVLPEYDVDVEVHNRAEIATLGMKAFLSVAMGSSEEPKFVVMKYMPLGEDVKPIVLVGKGLTYDSGGYSIKPTSGMVTMHCDMGGAGSVAGTMLALAKNKVQKNVIGVTALCENMISGNSYKPGDIIQSMSKKTIEVGNTDAEGRVTLADSLYYSATCLDPECIIDMATLTGACIAALGYEYTGAVTNDSDLYQRFEEASKKAGEKVWLLPADDAFRDAIKSQRADLINTSNQGAGTITAAMFLENFV